MFILMTHDGLNKLGKGSAKEHFCQIILKYIQWFLTRRFLKFSKQICRKINPMAMFLTNHDGLNNLGKGHQGTFLPNYIEISPMVSVKKIF